MYEDMKVYMNECKKAKMNKGVDICMKVWMNEHMYVGMIE